MADDQLTRKRTAAQVPAVIRYTLADRRIRVEENGCWQWVGHIGTGGYGRDVILRSGGRMGQAHRLVWERHRGAVPEGMVLDHTCRNRSCVNPDHLRAVSNRDNLYADGSLSPAKLNGEKANCPKCGGPYSPRFRTRPSNARVCRPCFNAKQSLRRSRIAALSRTGGTE